MLDEKVQHQTLHCDKCTGWLKMEYCPFSEIINEVRVAILDVPMLVCTDCGVRYQTDWAKMIFMPAFTDEAKKRCTNIATCSIKKAASRRYDICKEFDFKYDANDCEWIPGLMNTFTRRGFFTPVFFNQKVLHKYLEFDEYMIDIIGNTYGRVFFDDESSLSYGINRSDKVFCWLGDLEAIPQKEKFYLLSENIESDHDVGSEFYAGQLEAEFTNFSNERMLLNNRSDFDRFWNSKYSSKIFRYERDLYEILKDFKRPVNWNEKGVMFVFNAMSKVCIESMCRDAIEHAIKNVNPNFKAENMGSMKLLEELITITNPALDAKKIMMPFFVLYKFRVVLDHDHAEKEERKMIGQCCQRLGIPKNYNNFENLYDAVVEELTKSYSKIVNALS